MEDRSSRTVLVAIFAVLAAAIVVAARIYDGRLERHIRDEARAELDAVAHMKLDTIDRWLRERNDDAAVFAAGPMLAAVARGGTTPAEVDAVRRWLGAVVEQYGYRGVALVTADGSVPLAAGPRAPDEAQARMAAARALGAASPRRLVQPGEPGASGATLLIASPVAAAPGAALVLATDVEERLLESLDGWPTESASAETLLVRREDDRVVFLSRPRAGSGAPVTLADVQHPAVQAVLGREGLLQGKDDRGVSVLAVARRVPASAWYLVAKIDAAEVRADALETRRIFAFGVAALVALCGVAAALVWKVRRAHDLRASYEAERARRRAEEEARRTAEEHKLVLDSVGDAVIRLDLGLRITAWNAAAERMYGWTREEVAGELTSDVLRTEFGAVGREPMVRALTEHGRVEGVVRHSRRDGSQIYVELRGVALVGPDGARTGFALVNRDITARRDAEEALRASEERLQHVVEATGAGVWDVNVATGEAYFSPQWHQMLGYQPGEISDLSSVRALTHPADLADIDAAVQARRGDGQIYDADHRLRAKCGEWRWVHVRAKVVERDAAGRGVRIVGTSVDVTEQRDMQAKLLLSDRMASMGTLAAGVAHEINNPLSYVLSNVTYARDAVATLGRDPGAPPSLADAEQALAEAHEGAVRVRDIVRDLKSFSRASDESPAAVDLRRVIESAVQMARNEIRHRAQVRTHLEEVPPVLATESRLGQVVLNLLVNAAQAIPTGRADENEIAITLRQDGPGRVAVDVTDTGCGIAPDVLPRIFDPFFTTKSVGEGTGLGLAITHGIVSRLGGEIRVDSRPGKGSRFTVTLPAAASARSAAASRKDEPPEGPRAQVLVVDDEEQVGKAIQRALSRWHDVTYVRSAREALRRVGDGGCDVLLCDVLMPEMTGLELQRELRSVAPRLADRMIFMTGGAFAVEAARELADSPNRKLDKPFHPDELLAAVSGAL